MFFSRPKPPHFTFQERIEQLKKAGFTVEAVNGSKFKVSRGDCAAIVEDSPGCPPRIGRAGCIIGNDIGYLIDGGFQKFWKTAAGKRAPALATQLTALHDFEDDLRAGLGLETWYNDALGTTFDLHQYDRLEDRDTGTPHHPWEK
jgi:hypothetical protein